MKKGLKPEAFNKKLRESVIDVELIGKIAQAELVRAVYLNIIQNNPVLSGLSRRNWLVTLNKTTTNTVEETANVTGTGQSPTGDELARLTVFLIVLENFVLGQKVWIQNNLRYIRGLEEGRSDKAPAGMVELAIMQALSSGTKRKVKARAARLK